MFVKGINEFSNQHNSNMDTDMGEDFGISPIIDCKYFDINSFKGFKDNNKNFLIIHLNIASLEKHKEELENLLTLLNFKFDVIGIFESKFLKEVEPNFDIAIEGDKHFQLQ